MLGRSILLIAVIAAGLGAQTPTLQFGGSVGLISQGSPTSTESGFQLGVIAIRWIQPWLGFGWTFEMVRTSVDTRISPCYPYDETRACFHRPDTESLVSTAGRLQFKVPGDGGITLRGALGLAFNRSISVANPGERRTFVAPEFEAGVTWGHRPQAFLAVRVRNLDRWTGTTHGQGALLLGVMW
jgi:hypothetical protein